MNKDKKKLLLNKSGFTLVETIIAVGVFAIVISAAFGILAASITTQRALKTSQQSAEEFINATNLIAKRVRMSEILTASGTTNSISVKDNSDGNTYVYTFSGGGLKFGQNSATDTLVSNISGNFYVSADKPKRLTITMKPGSAGAGDNRTRIQTTVSTRVYSE